jgi:hypothetical protein
MLDPFLQADVKTLSQIVLPSGWNGQGGTIVAGASTCAEVTLSNSNSVLVPGSQSVSLISSLQTIAWTAGSHDATRSKGGRNADERRSHP